LIKLAGLFGQCDFLRPYGSSMAVLSGAKRNADTGPRLADVSRCFRAKAAL
jgi:hypothetical protein